MASKITLDSIRKAAEDKYGDRVVELGDGVEVTLRNPLRMKKEDREKLSALDPESDDDPIAYFEEAFSLVASKAEAKKIREVFGDDVTLYISLFEMYTAEAQLGEASPSQD